MTETATDIDTATVESYLSAELDARIIDTEVLHDGLNASIGLSTEAEERAYVLRRPNKLRHTGLFNDLEREYRLLQRLEGTTIRAPAPVLFCDDESVLGSRFIVTTFLDGETVPLGSDLPERFRNARSRRELADRLVETLAAIHSLDVGRFEDACERISPREQVDRAIERLDRARSVTGRVLPRLRSVAEWLRRHAPMDSRTTLVHGDFRPGNVLFAGTDRPEITGVLDWETAMLGDPLTELGYLLLRWRDDGDPTPALDDLEARYPNGDAMSSLRDANERGLSPFTNRPGSPSRRELVGRYEAETCISVENERFYRAHAAFMLATVWEDLHRYRVEAGEESDGNPRVEYMSMMADSVVSGDLEL